MEERFPDFVLQRADDGTLYWEGEVEPFPEEVFLVSVSYPRRFPYERPVLRVEEPPLVKGAPHRYADGSLCIHADKWDPQRATAASCVPLIGAWLVRYVHWLEEGAF